MLYFNACSGTIDTRNALVANKNGMVYVDNLEQTWTNLIGRYEFDTHFILTHTHMYDNYHEVNTDGAAAAASLNCHWLT